MGADLDLIQRAIVFGVAMICTLLDGAFNALVCIVVHGFPLLLLSSTLVCPTFKKVSKIILEAEPPDSGGSKNKEERKMRESNFNSAAGTPWDP